MTLPRTFVPRWWDAVVPAANPETGCVPWGIAMLLRAAQRDEGIDLTELQRDLDFTREVGDEENEYARVAEAASRRDPPFQLEVIAPPTGDDKATVLRDRAARGLLTLAQLPFAILYGPDAEWFTADLGRPSPLFRAYEPPAAPDYPSHACHSMPIVGADAAAAAFLVHTDPADNIAFLATLPFDVVAYAHDAATSRAAREIAHLTH